MSTLYTCVCARASLWELLCSILALNPSKSFDSFVAQKVARHAEVCLKDIKRGPLWYNSLVL
jgi:hypothetical protein